MASHVWSKGLISLTDGAASPSVTSWRSIYATTYTGYWRCALETAMGTYTSDQYETANTETTGTAYATKGVDITGGSHDANTVSLDSSGAYVEYVCTTSPQWTSASFSAAYATIMASTGTRSSSPVLCVFDLGGSKTVTSGTFTLTFGTDHSVTTSVFNLAVA